MKKYVFLFVATFLLAGCSGQDEQETKPEPKADNEVTTTDEEAVSVQFNNIDITTPDGKILVKGNATASNDVFYFTLKYGEEVVVDETKVKLDTDESGWGTFELEIEQPKDAETKEEIPLFTFYVKNEAGEMVNPNYIPVDVVEK
ncbi:lipoprotein [Lentibacillus sp. Marseille-P4043]|uniref:lipoprotein n=1 Tax=Lentibacillus sp. Marseille-P4043 TaxID=2040293 RepID=UPI000D0B9252|nr:membrane lipoprotein lipid attachment site-containing protein [Lentibacillus sp. Marseille-P4043]